MAKINLNRDDPAASIDQLDAGLKNLSLEDNFTGFFWEGEIEPLEEVLILNKFRDGKIPEGYLIVSCTVENSVVRGVAEWTDKRVSLLNTSATNTINVKAFFFR